MGLGVPLAVRITTARADVHITRWIRGDLVFREVAAGGYANATMSINRPLNVRPDELHHFARVTVYDAEGVVWAGRLEDLDVEDGGDGQVWRLACMGSSVHAGDKTFPIVYVRRATEGWQRSSFSSTDTKTGSFRVDETVGGNQSVGIWLAFPGGFAVTTNKRIAAVLTELAATGQKLALVNYQWDCGFSNASGDWKITLMTEDGTVARNENPNTAGAGGSVAVIGTNWSSGQQYPFLMLRYLGAGGSVSDTDVAWVVFDEVVVVGTRYNRDGTEKTSGYGSSDTTILASTVVEDLLGRVLGDVYDATGAVVDTTTYGITELAWPDGITAAGVLGRLMELEPGYRWGAYEPNGDGLYRFEWTAWPSEVRYEADTVDGYDAPSSAGDLYNEVRVFYLDGRGKPKSVTVTQTVPELDDAGLTRQARLELDSGTDDDATQAGTEFLAEHAKPPARGTLTVARPIFDRLAGRWVQPWQIRAGELIRVRSVQPRAEALTATGRDGISVFKIAAREYRAASAAARLELDEYTLSTARALAAAASTPGRPGRPARPSLWR